MNIRVSSAFAGGIVRAFATAMLIVQFSAFGQSPGPGMSQRAALRIQEQSTWGPTADGTRDLQTFGFDQWFLKQTLHSPSTIPDQPLLNPDGTAFTSVAPLQANFYSNALTGDDQLRQRVAFALSEIWVVSNLDLDRGAAFPPILRIFQNDAFGNYRTLMQDITLNPAMGHYLDMANNNKGVPAKNTAANENYAREVMQLFTLGLYQLNIDGSQVMSNGIPVATYSQDTVTNLAKMLTGWTYAPVSGSG